MWDAIPFGGDNHKLFLLQIADSNTSYQDTVVLLTATIDARNSSDLQRSDPQLRLSDYQQSLKLWMQKKDIPKLIFCENSGYDCSALLEYCTANNPHQKEIEFISFDDNNYPREYGKGYGEMRIIEHVLGNSRLIRPDSLIIKVTGRLYCAGIGTILNRIKSNPRADIYCNLTSDQSRAESYLFFTSVFFLQRYLIPLKERINDSKGCFFEHVLALAVHASLADGRKWSLIPGFIDLRGISGTTGILYTRNLISRLKGMLFYRLKIFVLFRED